MISCKDYKFEVSFEELPRSFNFDKIDCIAYSNLERQFADVQYFNFNRVYYRFVHPYSIKDVLDISDSTFEFRGYDNVWILPIFEGIKNDCCSVFYIRRK